MGKAIFKQRNGVLGVGIITPCGFITPEQLLGLGKLLPEVGAVGSKLTTRQTLLVLLPEENLERFTTGLRTLGLELGGFGDIVRNVKGCPGSPALCHRSLSDVFELAVEIQGKFSNQPTPHDFKISVAGCHRGCTDPHCADFGVTAVGQNDFDIYLGGRGGSRNPVHAQRAYQKVSREAVFTILEHVLQTYRQLAEEKERLCLTIRRVGMEPFILPADKLPKAGEEANDFLDFLND
ncbi:nitrite reductase [Heliobacterium gestii]|uniref:Nitrite reductase n=1 Tax=Heliomicrobium gestii TaxID=2699 RepID=A0A845LLG4_HELGE|nr:nitrite reductase [Heliomicrobium gestii]MBM7867422.1 dissimilatory sulfite reductase (desulfoviridin) alpha/beta subunit [Heliomicrobium gestii]MZP43686.1 nitrite reductase [Heliomicrobium gestii]